MQDVNISRPTRFYRESVFATAVVLRSTEFVYLWQWPSVPFQNYIYTFAKHLAGWRILTSCRISLSFAGIEWVRTVVVSMISALFLHACLIPILFIIAFAFNHGRSSSELECLFWDTVLAEILFIVVHLSLEQGCSMRRYWKKGGSYKKYSVAVDKAI